MSLNETEDLIVTRAEIAAYVGSAFEGGPASAEQLIATARGNGANEQVIDLLMRLTRQSYRDLRQIWPELSGVPVSR